MNVMKGLWDMHDQSKQLLLFSFAGHKKELDQEGEKIHSDDSGGGPGLSRSIGLFLGPALFLFILYGLSIEGMPQEAQAVLASTAWVAVWWITEAIPKRRKMGAVRFYGYSCCLDFAFTCIKPINRIVK